MWPSIQQSEIFPSLFLQFVHNYDYVLLKSENKEFQSEDYTLCTIIRYNMIYDAITLPMYVVPIPVPTYLSLYVNNTSLALYLHSAHIESNLI